MINGVVLIIAEKPQQGEKLSSPFPHKKHKDHIQIFPCDIFPKGAILTWACGHILESYSPSDYDPKLKEWSMDTLPIIPRDLKFKLKVIESKKFYFNSIKKFLNDPSIGMVIHSADFGVEGQLLIDEILYFLNNKKPVKRLVTVSLTKDSIIKAFKNLRDNKEFIGYYNATLARQRADWLVGMSSSRCLTILLNQKGINKTFSAGRVQTALTGLIYQREKDIENFVSEPYWDCLADFQFGEHLISGKWFNSESDHIFDHDAAVALGDFCKGNHAQVYSVMKEEKKVRPPQLFNLSSLQMEANRLFGMSPASVLEFAQKLYDKSLLTYPRSDSRYLTPEEAKWFPVILENLAKIDEYKGLVNGATVDISNDKRFVDSTRVSDHYAIIPTEEFVNPLTLPRGEQLIYDLVAKSVIAAHHPDHVYDFSEIIFAVQHRFTFKSKGKQVTQQGWKAVFRGIEKEESQENDNEEILPPLNEGEEGFITSIVLKEGATSPLPRLSQGDLVRIMSNAGSYVKEKDDFKNSELSLGTEATRAQIIETVTSRYIKVHKNLVYLQPEGRILIEALGQDNFLTSVLTTGRMERSLNEIQSGKGSVEDFTKRTVKLTQMIVEKLKMDAPGWNFGEYVKEIQEAEVIGKCKICGSDVMDYGNFYGCSSFKETECEFKIPKKILGKPISKENVQKLLETGTTSLIKGFKPKEKDSTFDAFVVWNDNNKRINFRYK